MLDLDLLPYPDYDDYFTQFAASRLAAVEYRRWRSRRRAAAGGARSPTARSAA